MNREYTAHPWHRHVAERKALTVSATVKPLSMILRRSGPRGSSA